MKDRVNINIYILFLEYIVLIAMNFPLEILYAGLSLFIHNEKAHAEAAQGGEGGALRSCESQSLGIGETSTNGNPLLVD